MIKVNAKKEKSVTDKFHGIDKNETKSEAMNLSLVIS